MPPREHGAISKRIKVQVNVSEPIKRVLQTIIQAAAGAIQGRLPRVIDALDVSSFNWNSTPGHVVTALLSFAGLDWSHNGHRVFKRGQPSDYIVWQQPLGKGTLQPAAARANAVGDLQHMDLQHDAEADVAGTARARAAAEAARPEAPRTLELVKAAAVDRLGRGSGWGNTPRPLAERCLAEQPCLDALVAIGEAHARAHPDHCCS